MSKQQQIVVTNTTPDATEMGLVVRPIGGSGGGDVTIIGPLGSQLAADSVSVALASDQIPLPVSFSEPIQQVTGTLDANGEILWFPIEGSKGVSVNFVSSSFSGTVRFIQSTDGGPSGNWSYGNGISIQSRNIVNIASVISGFAFPNDNWSFVTTGGETHVGVRVESYASGSLDVIISGTSLATNAVVHAAAEGSLLQEWIGVGVENLVSGQLVPLVGSATTPIPGLTGLVTRDVSGKVANGAAIFGYSDLMNIIAANDPDGPNLARVVEIRDEDPVSDDFGVIVRPIIPVPTFDSGLVELTNTLAVLTASTIKASGLVLCNINGSAHLVTVTNTAGDFYLKDFPLQAGMTVSIPLFDATIVGVKWNADANASVNAQLVGKL